jgi:hypothetical protein
METSRERRRSSFDLQEARRKELAAQGLITSSAITVKSTVGHVRMVKKVGSKKRHDRRPEDLNASTISEGGRESLDEQGSSSFDMEK